MTELHPAPPMPGPTSHSFFSQRLRLHYVDWGNAGAPPLVLVHGGRDHCRNWDWVAQALRKDWHVICPDLRGHGDSQWSPDGNYSMAAYIYDLAQLIHQQNLAPVTIVAHSLGGNICLRYTGIHPDKVRKLVNIEGLGPSPLVVAKQPKVAYAAQLREWIAKRRRAAGRQPRRYPTIEAAYARMKEENGFLTDEQAYHLTAHGVSRNEDGSWSWKFDNYLNVWPVASVPTHENELLWQAITCPMLLLYGTESFAVSPGKDGRLAHFPTARLVEYEHAGHWLHHDQFDRFMADLKGFL